MASPLAVDTQGNALLRLVRCTNEQLEEAASRTSCPLALMIVVDESSCEVLFGLNRWHQSYELPGGIVESGESFERAAIRELKEETGMDADAVELVGYAHFALTNPIREELGAIYRRPRHGQDAHDSDELTDFVWRIPLETSEREISTLDDVIAAWVLESDTSER